MPTYYWKFQELFNTGDCVDVFITIIAVDSKKAKNILINRIIKMTRFGIPKIFITPKANTVISHSNNVHAINLPYITIDYVLFQKILYLEPKIAFTLNHQANPFIPNAKD